MSTLLAASIPLDTDGTLAANSDSKVATQKATKTYADTKGVVDGQQIFDGIHVICFDGGTRQLIASDSSTVALDWSDPTALVIFGNTLANANGLIGDGSQLTNIVPSDRLASTTHQFGFELGSGNSSWQPNEDYPIQSFDGNTYFDNSGFHTSADTFLTALPTSDPNVSGQLWKFTGTVTTLTSYLAGGGDIVVASQG